MRNIDSSKQKNRDVIRQNIRVNIFTESKYIANNLSCSQGAASAYPHSKNKTEQKVFNLWFVATEKGKFGNTVDQRI